MENDWRNYSSFEISNKEMREKILFYVQQQETIKKHYMKNDVLPIVERFRNKADDMTVEYFQNFF